MVYSTLGITIINPEYLKYGAIGLSFLLAFLSFGLLTKEQSKKIPNNKIINSIYIFMSFSLILSVISFGLDYFKENNTNKVEMSKIDQNKKIFETQAKLRDIQKDLSNTQRGISNMINAKSGLIDQLESIKTSDEDTKKFFDKIIKNLKSIDETIKKSLEEN